MEVHGTVWNLFFDLYDSTICFLLFQIPQKQFFKQPHKHITKFNVDILFHFVSSRNLKPCYPCKLQA